MNWGYELCLCVFRSGGRSCDEVDVYRFFYFFKQKTAYEMRISDWSSDVCSSDLIAGGGDAVEQRLGHLGIAEDGGPLAEREVRGEDDAGALIKLADEVEQQLPSRACERQISKLVEHDQVEPRQLRRQGPALADPGLLFKACHQIDGVEVAGASASSHDIGCDRDGKVGLPRPRAADKHDIAPGWQDGAIMKGPDHLLIDRIAVEAEPLQILHHG